MKKNLKVVAVLTLCAALIMPSTAFASSDSSTPQLISEKKVQLTVNSNGVSSLLSRAVNKEFTLRTYNDKGVTVYGFDVEDPEYRQSAQEYINGLTGDPASSYGEIQSFGILLPGQSEYHNDTQYDGSAVSYAWKRNTADTWNNNFEGGQSSLWSGSGNANYIVLNQGISISGIAVTISWPPSVSGSGNSASWQSQPVYSNVTGASFSGMTVSGTAFSCSFSENGDVYVGSRIYRPVTYIGFSYFS